MSIVRYSIFLAAFVFYSQVFAQNIPYIHADSLIKVGITLHDEGKFEEAIAYYDQVHEGDTTYLLAQTEKVTSLEALERYEEAIALGIKLLTLPSEHHEVLYNSLGSAYDMNEQPDSAIAVYSRGLQSYPYSFLLHYNLATTYSNQSRFEEALDEYQKALKINPFHANSHLSLAVLTAKMGLHTKTQLALSMYLALVPSNNQALVALNDMFIGSWGLFGTEKNIIDNTAFDEIDLIIKSKAALDDKFKSAIKFEAPVAQQSEMILELLEASPGSDDFWMQLYVPLFSRVQSEGLSEAFIYYILKSANNKDVDKWLKNNDKELDRFFAVANEELKKYRSTQRATLAGIEDEYTCWHYGNNAFNAIVKENEAGENVGPFEFYYSNQQLQAKGSYNDQGKKIGKWVYYYSNGILSKIEEYNNEGVLEGPVMVYHENGELKTIIPYKNDQVHGVVKIHHLPGTLKEDFPFSEGEKHGNGMGWYTTGAKHFEYTYNKGKLTGEIRYYFATGELYETYTYQEGELNGPYKDYFIDGTIYQEGSYAHDLKDGPWIIRFSNGKTSSQGSYKEDKQDYGRTTPFQVVYPLN